MDGRLAQKLLNMIHSRCPFWVEQFDVLPEGGITWQN
jgi:hypothetical protein